MSNFGRHIALSGIDWLAHDEDANTAYLFECDDEGLFAISSQRDGRNIPIGLCAEGWQLKQAFLLGAREAVPFDLHPKLSCAPLRPRTITSGAWDRTCLPPRSDRLHAHSSETKARS